MAKILLVDDESTVRMPLRRALEMDGHEVSEAQDGAEGLELLTSALRPYNLLISDIRMPVMDGIALTLAVAAQFPALPIILMTGYAEQRERAHELEGLVRDVLSKPFSLADFRAAVHKVLTSLPPYSE